MPIIKTNGIDLYYEIHGESRADYPLVLIAGLGYSLWMWERMLPYLAQEQQVIVFDNRGVGRSSKPPGPYSAELLADDTADLIKGLGFTKAAVMGHSMGGFVAQALALKYPERIGHLILSATNFGGPRHVPITAEAMAVLSDVSSPPEERFRRGLLVSTAPGFAEANPQIIESWLEYRRQNPIEPAPYQAQMAIGLGLLTEAACFEKRLNQVSSPTLILFGEHDLVVPPANASLLAEQIPNSHVRILSKAGHFFPIEIPAEASRAVLDFIKEVQEKT